MVMGGRDDSAMFVGAGDRCFTVGKVSSDSTLSHQLMNHEVTCGLKWHVLCL